MAEDRDDRESAPIDVDLLDRIGRRLGPSARFAEIEFRPAYAPSALVVHYDRRYFPPFVERATLRIRWFQNDDFAIHYAERREDGDVWQCRWDRHPSDHNSRDHFHPPPDATTPGRDVAHPSDWRDVLRTVLESLDAHVRGFWE